MGKAARNRTRAAFRKYEREHHLFLRATAHMDVYDLWFHAGHHPDLVWREHAALVVHTWIMTSDEDEALAIRATRPEFLHTLDDFLEFTKWAVCNGRLTAQHGIFPPVP